MSRVRSHNQGYTIVEIMIFLAVSGALFISAMILVSGQQAKTEFSQAMADIQTQLQDTANDVSTGYYAKPGNIKCTNVGGRPKPIDNGGTDAQGTNQDCVFMGRFLHFAPLPVSDPESVLTYSVVGLRTDSTGKEATTYDDAKPTAISPSTSICSITCFDATQSSKLQGGLTVKKAYYKMPAGTKHPISGFGFMSTLAIYDAGGTISGSQSVNIMPIDSPASQDQAAFAESIDNLHSSSLINPASGVIICFESGGTDQYGVITIGANGRSLTPQLAIVKKSVATAFGGVCGP